MSDLTITPCMRCGDPGGATWLVTGSPESQAPGRLFLYCSECQRGNPASFEIVLPLRMVARDPDAWMTHLYAVGAVTAEPTAVADWLGWSGPWVQNAEIILRRRWNDAACS